MGKKENNGPNDLDNINLNDINDNDKMLDNPIDNSEMNNSIEGSDKLESNDETMNFDNDFDAGVDADEESDPKRYIQQLTGKLSQKLRDYNESLGETDADLNKYVAGMIVKQAVKGLDDNDKKEIIHKINDDSDDSTKSNDDISDKPLSSDEELGDNMPMESKSFIYSKKQLKKLSENFGGNNEIISSKKNDERIDNTPINKIKQTKINAPFIAPSFK